ncbi:MAG: hypothetical protein ACK5GO_02630 [Ignavibacteria bacterium]|jgi:hypothetical protein
MGRVIDTYIRFIVLSVMICISLTICQGSEFKIGGFRMGMSSEEVIAVLTTNAQYSVYDYNNSKIKDLTLNDSVNNMLECDVYPLYSKTAKIVSLVYNGIVMKYPQFQFINNKLVLFSATVNINEVYSSIETKYGKPSFLINNNQVSIWSHEREQLSIVNPSAFKNYAENVIKEGTFKLSNESVFEECKKHVERERKEFLNNLIKIENNRISVFDIPLGSMKKDFIRILTKKYGYQNLLRRMGWDSYDAMQMATDTALYFADTITIDLSSRTFNGRITCYFYNDRIYLVGLHQDSQSNVTPKFASNQQSILEQKYPSNCKRIVKYDKKNKNIKLIDELLLETENEKVSISNIFGSSFGYIECVSKTVLSKLEKDRYNDIARRMRIFVSKLDQSELLNIKLNAVKPRSSFAGFGRMDKAINKNYSNSIHKIEQHDWPGISPFPNHEFIGNKYKDYCCPLTTFEIMSKDDVVISLSGSFIQRVNLDNTKVRSEMRDILISELASKYGQANQIEYADELHYYWIIGNCIFDVTYKSKSDMELSSTFNFSFRIYDPYDFLLNKNVKKSIVD